MLSIDLLSSAGMASRYFDENKYYHAGETDIPICKGPTRSPGPGSLARSTSTTPTNC